MIREPGRPRRMQRVVLAYSGGLDTSIIIPWLRETRACEVHCLAGDVGQGSGELDGLEAKALASGAASCRVVDLRAELLEQACWPALRALAVYDGRYLLGTSLARPILARAQVAYAREVGADALAHGCTGKGNDQVRFELAYMALAPELEIVAPWRTWEIESREDALEYAATHGIAVSASRERIYSRDRNLWHLSHEGGALEDPALPPPDDLWILTTDPREAPDRPAEVRVAFERGCPVALDGERLAPVPLVERLNALAGAHGVGRVDLVENRLVGIKSRGCYETPAGTLLYEAARSLRSLTVERDTAQLAERLAGEWARLVYNGQWFHPLREALDAFFERVAEPVTGEVRVRLYKGAAASVAVESPRSLYSHELASFGAIGGAAGCSPSRAGQGGAGAGPGFDRTDSRGFVRLFGLSATVAARVGSLAARASRAGERGGEPA